MRRSLLILAILVIVNLVGILVILAARPSPTQITIIPPQPTATPFPTPTHEPILVYVTGAVQNPQTQLSLPYRSRVQDAVEGAGGATANADLTLVNLVDILHDGDLVYVPTIGEAQVSVPTRTGGGIVYINTASLAELTTLPGIGEVTAQAIIDYRETNGDFTALEQLDAVEGIGTTTLESIRDLVSFD